MYDAELELQVVDDVREDIADGRAEQGQDDDHDDRNKDQDEGVFYEALTLFTRLIQHDDISLRYELKTEWYFDVSTQMV